jgi:hypothetical protein
VDNVVEIMIEPIGISMETDSIEVVIITIVALTEAKQVHTKEVLEDTIEEYSLTEDPTEGIVDHTGVIGAEETTAIVEEETLMIVEAEAKIEVIVGIIKMLLTISIVATNRLKNLMRSISKTKFKNL